MIKASCDIMSVDVGSDSKMMNVIKDTYKTVINSNSVEIDAIVTGKGTRFGGLEAYEKSFGLGTASIVNFLEQNCGNFKSLRETNLQTGGSKKSVILKGFGKNGAAAARELLEMNSHFKIVGITHGGYGIYNQIGIDPEEMSYYLEKHDDRLEGFSKNVVDEHLIMSRKCDIIIATDKEFSINEELAKTFNCKVFVDGLNASPLTFEAESILLQKKVLIIPSVLSYSGQFICGYLEWLKNLEHRNLTILFKRFEKNLRNQFISMITKRKDQKEVYEGPTENELVITTIQEMMDQAFSNVIETAENDGLTLRQAAYSIGLNRVYNHYKEKGISL